MSARQNVSVKRKDVKISNDKIPKTIGSVKAGVTVIKHREVKEGIIVDIEVVVNGLVFNRSYFINHSLNRNEMIDFITKKIKEEQTSIFVPTFEVIL